MNIYITLPMGESKDTFITKKVKEQLRELGDVRENPFSVDLTVDELIHEAQQAEVLISGWGTAFLQSEHIEKMPNLKIIAHTGASVATLVDSGVCDCGVRVLSGNGVFAKSVAEGCLCYTLAALRELEKYVGLVRRGGWREENFTNRGLIGKRVGLIGFGEIAKYYAQLLEWFDVTLLVHSTHLSEVEAQEYHVQKASLEEIFSTCDVVSIHSALTPKTEKMITKELMMRMKPNALLVNTARGKVVDEVAMTQLLGEKRFFAAIDVFSKEPIDVDDPLRKMENALLIPHMGGPTIDMREIVTLELIKDLKRFQAGETLRTEISQDWIKRMSRNV